MLFQNNFISSKTLKKDLPTSSKEQRASYLDDFSYVDDMISQKEYVHNVVKKRSYLIFCKIKIFKQYELKNFFDVLLKNHLFHKT